ncbi:MAG: NTP transferase domain-containing protein [Mariniphaga sp.]|nr:NTP transferase domain-containing protein [Mariniphaga sp.]
MGREAIILAGGKGTRLQPLVSDRPKPMALINSKPFLYYLLNHLSKNNFKHIILAVGFKHELIYEFFGNKFKEVKISYAVEKKPLGTGGAILNALKLAQNHCSFILNGDTYFPVAFEQMEKLSIEKNSDLILALRELNDVSRYGTISLNKSKKVIDFIEKKGEPSSGFINGGIYYLRNLSLKSLTFPKVFSFENDYLAKHNHSQNFYGEIFKDYFIDIGIPETFKQAQSDFFTFED